MTKTKQRTIARNIEIIPNVNGKCKYRCRVYRNGTRYEHYETNLRRAQTWIKNFKGGLKTS